MTEPIENKGYAGDVTPEQAAQWIASAEAVLVDVRTDAEREWVGYINDFIARKLASGELPALYRKWIGQDMDKDLPATGETESALPRVVAK